MDRGTGAYTRAHGTFKVSGGGPAGGMHTVGLSGGLRIYTTNGFSARTH
jgi:hypothetical protein